VAASRRPKCFEGESFSPRLDFLVLPLTPASLSNIEKAIDPRVAFNRDAGIVHVQIEKHGQIAFAAYDQFHQDSVVAYPAVPIALLNELVANVCCTPLRQVDSRKISDNVGGVQTVFERTRPCIRRARHFALVEETAIPTTGSLVIVSGQ